MTLRDELYELSEQPLNQQNNGTEDIEMQERISQYLTKKLKEIAAKGKKSCIISLGVPIDPIDESECRLYLKDVIEFASKNGLDCSYPRIMNITEATLSWRKK